MQRQQNIPPNIPPEMFAVILVAVLVLVAIGLIVSIFFYLTLSRALSHVDPQNREMEPGQVWLNLIPCFGIVWIFITVSRIAGSLRKEYRDRGYRTKGENFGQSIGTTFPILALCGAIPFIGFLFSLGSLVCMIMYWVQISNYSAKLADGESILRRGRRDDDRDYDDDDDERRPDDDDDDDRFRDKRRREDDDRFR